MRHRPLGCFQHVQKMLRDELLDFTRVDLLGERAQIDWSGTLAPGINQVVKQQRPGNDQ